MGIHLFMSSRERLDRLARRAHPRGQAIPAPQTPLTGPTEHPSTPVSTQTTRVVIMRPSRLTPTAAALKHDITHQEPPSPTEQP